MNRRRHQSAGSQVLNQLRDYAVPIIGLLLVIVIIYNAFSGTEPITTENNGTEQTDTQLNQSNKMTLDFDTTDTTGFVEYSGWSKDKLSEKNELYPGEKLIVDSWDVTLKSAWGLLMKLNKNWELKYDSNGDYLLSSSDLFVKTNEALNMNLRFLDVVLPSSAIVSLNQNEVASTINVLSGNVQISSFAGKQTTLKAGEKLSITSVETTKDDFDISAQVEDIGNYFFSETWAQDNDLISYLETTDSSEEGTSSGTTDSTDSTSETTKYITFEWIEDNKTYGSSTFDISWIVNDDRVSKVTFNNKVASINLVGKTYELKNFSIPLRENDIVYKIYDSSENILDRGVYTVYYKQGTDAVEKDSTTVEFPVTDSNPQFAFTSPNPNPYTSNENFITIRGSASAGAASSVTVNGLKLNSFNGTTWRYHAATQFATLKNGVNLYKVNYYGADGAVLHTNTFTIIRKAPATPVVEAVVPTEAEVPAAQVDSNDSWKDTIGDRIPL